MATAGRLKARWIVAGLAAAVALHGAAGWWSVVALAQSGGVTTFSVSTEFVDSTETPPDCSVIGSTRMVESAPTVTNSIGPMCIGIGERFASVTNPDPTAACTYAIGGVAAAVAPFAAPPLDPFHGQVFLVAPGSNDINISTTRTTFTCVAAVPVLPWPALAALGGLLTSAGAWWMRRRS